MNRPIERRALLAWAPASLLAAIPVPGLAAEWPAKAVTLVVPFPPGNTADLAGRAMQEPLSKALGQSFVVDNRTGAGGNLALQVVAQGEKDGHQLLLTTASPLTINPSIYKNAGFDAERDFVPVAVVGSVQMILIANKDLPVASMTDFANYARANADRLSFGSVGNGSFSHLGMEMICKAVGVKLTHVPYRGASPAHTDLVGGRLDFMLDSLASANALLKGQRVKAIATTGTKRSPFSMDTPTLIESGLKGLANFEVTVWVGLFAPRGTPANVIQRLNDEVGTLLRSTGFRAQLAAQFIRADDPLTQAQFAQRVSADRARWGGMAKELGLSLS